MRVRDGYNPLAFIVVMAFILGMGVNEYNRDNDKVQQAYDEFVVTKMELTNDFKEWASTIEGGVCGTPLQMDIINAQFDIYDKYGLTFRQQEQFQKLAEMDNTLR